MISRTILPALYGPGAVRLIDNGRIKITAYKPGKKHGKKQDKNKTLHNYFPRKSRPPGAAGESPEINLVKNVIDVFLDHASVNVVTACGQLVNIIMLCFDDSCMPFSGHNQAIFMIPVVILLGGHNLINRIIQFHFKLLMFSLTL